MRTRSVLSVLSLAALAAARTASADNIAYSLHNVGLVGGIYTGSGNLEKATLTIINSGGDGVGFSTIYNGTGASVGSADWYYNPIDQSTTQIGLTGANGSVYLNSSGFVNTSSVSSLTGLSATGCTAGVSSRFTGATSLGSDAWVYSPGTGTVALPNPVAIATDPAGTAYTKTVSGSTFDGFSGVSGVSNTGQVAGGINRYDSSGNSIGSDAYYYQPAIGSIPATITIIGLFGTSNVSPTNGARSPIISGMGVNGQVVATQSHYLANGSLTSSDAWYYAPGSSGAVKINLTDPASATTIGHTTSVGVQQNGINGRINVLGQTLGFSSRYSTSDGYIGQDVFMYDPSTQVSKIIGLTGTGYVNNTGTQSNFYNTSAINSISDGGQAAGYTNRDDTVTGATGLGQDTWVYDSQKNTTIAIALTGGSYTNSNVTVGDFHSSKPLAVSNAGQVAGIASRYTATGGTLGQDAWYYAPPASGTVTGIQAPTRVGLIGGVYEASGGTVGTRSSTISVIDATGEVGGNSTRYVPSTSVANGQEAWVYSGGTTVAVTASVAPSDTSQYFFSTVTAMIDGGFTVGYYSLTNPAAITNETAFAWSPANGFINLGFAVSPSTTLAQWTDLAQAMKISAAGTIFGNGQLAGDSSASQSVFRLNRLGLGDANGDGVVDLNDLNTVLNNLGTVTSAWSSGNFDGASTIDLNDLNDVLNNLGVHTAPGGVLAVAEALSPNAVPEPASLSVLAAGCLLIGRRRSTRR